MVYAILLALWFAGLEILFLFVVRETRVFWWPLVFRLLWRLSTPSGVRPGSFFRCVAWLTSPRPSRRRCEKYISLPEYVRQLKAHLLWQCSPWNPANLPHALRATRRRLFNRRMIPAEWDAVFRQAAEAWQENLARFRALHAAGKCPCWKCRWS